MTRTQTALWWLLALCGVLDALIAALNLLMSDLNGTWAPRLLSPIGGVWDISVLSVATGVCLIVAGIVIGGRERLLSLHGLALGTFGLIGLSPLVRGPLRFRPISLLFVVMSLSIAAYALGNARTRWPLWTAGAASFAFAVSFLMVGFARIRLEPISYWSWMSSFFAFCAIFLLWLAVNLTYSWRSAVIGSRRIARNAGR